MNKIVIEYGKQEKKISKYIYGHFAEHIGGVMYDGLYVGEDSNVPNVKGFRKDIIDLLKNINIPVLRWPGGCFVENYDWRDGIGEQSTRPIRVNFWHNDDGKLESNKVGTHEFAEFCEILGTEPYFAVNCTTTPAIEARNWVEYCTFDKDTTLTRLRKENGREEPFNIPFWGLGNECWGDGGRMSGDYYACIYNNYSSVVSRVKRDGYYIACGPNENDKKWTKSFFEQLYSIRPAFNPIINGYSMHYYTRGGGHCIDFNESEWYNLLFNGLKMKDYIEDQRAIIDEYDPERKIGLIVDEWGAWHPVNSGPSKGANLFEQQSTVRDALLAALTLNIFNDKADIVKMANVAQVCNNLHCLFLTVGEKLIVTPTYYVFDMMKGHQDANALAVTLDTDYIGVDKGIEIPRISVSASEKDGKTLVTLANTSYSEECELTVELTSKEFNGEIETVLLTAENPNDYNDVDCNKVVPVCGKVQACGGKVTLKMPKASVMSLSFETK